MWKRFFVVLGVFLLLIGLHTRISTAKEAENQRPTARIHSEGQVLAKPDVATLIFKIETEAPKAQDASEENARRAESFLPIMKETLAEGESIQSIGFGVTPIYSYPKRGKGSKITGYRARHCFRIRLNDLKRVGKVIDTGLQNGATGVQGPYFEHSRLEELTRQAALQALAQARRMAEALAQAENLKIKRLQQVSTEVRGWPSPRNLRAAAFAQEAAPKTPIEVGEEEIRARIEAIFELE